MAFKVGDRVSMSEYRRFLITVKSYLAKELSLRNGSLVLDCGTGRGLFASALADQTGVKVVSVDSSIRSITEARPVLRGNGLVRADIRFLPFLGLTFEIILSLKGQSMKFLQDICREFYKK